MKTSAAAADGAASEPSLVFDWRRPSARWGRLFLWVLATLVCVVAFFALFRVVYPQPSRFIPNAQQITLINPGTPSGRTLLATVQDHDFMILPPDGSKGSAALDENAPVFHPSFEKRELHLQDLPQRNSRPVPVRLMDVTEPVLPPLDLTGMKPEPSPGALPELVPVLTLDGGLGGRKIVSAPDLTGLPGADLDGVRFHLGVDSEGRVVFILPVNSPGKAEETEPVLQRLDKLRLDTRRGESPVWGFATIKWRQSPAK